MNKGPGATPFPSLADTEFGRYVIGPVADTAVGRYGRGMVAGTAVGRYGWGAAIISKMIRT